MGARGELFTTQVILDNRSYFFNVKENRTGDVFLQIVEYLKGFEAALSFIEKQQKEKSKLAMQKKTAKKVVYRSKASAAAAKDSAPEIKRTGRVHIVSKRTAKKENK